jgi:hypothetical protein
MNQAIKFDPSQPYGEVFGQPGLAYVQNGKTFNGAGELVTDFSSLVPVDSIPDGPTPDDGSIPKCYIQENTPKENKDNGNLDLLHWKQLQQMLNIYGEPFKNREQAIAFLKGI